MNEKKPMVPLISTSVAGPSGIMHLPRLWLKILLHASGRLAEGYRHGAGGFDERLCDHFQVDQDAFVAYVETNKPDYMASERYVLEHAKNVTPDSIAAFNEYVTQATIPDPARAKALRERTGVTDETFANAIALNNLDDWLGAHEALTKR
jgi:hypothetical protein